VPQYKNIIFDFGNVLFDLDLPATARRFQEILGDEKATAARRKLEHDKVFLLYETGGLSTQEFLDALRCASDPPISEADALHAWNAIFLEMPAPRFDMLLELRQRYQVFLLSNINDLHERWIANYMQESHGITDFETRFFDGVYYSHLLRLRKPEPEIYEYVLADAELNPAETLFFDDLPENIEAARRLGIHGVVKPPEVEIIEVVRRLL
jgi:putative hydrolase of the HAD superfamily